VANGINTLRTACYDAENRMVSETDNSGVLTTYAYDGNGARVSKTTGGVTTTYVYDAFGNLAAEYGGTAASPCGAPTCYVTSDHLGSTRMLTDSNGVVQQRYDYLPFGEELLAGNGRNGFGYNSSPDYLNPKFTGQTRDHETTLDWFNVRYMSGAQGRFQSVDPGNAGANPADPQTWNAYSYVGNNPLSYTDSSGLGLVRLLERAGDCARDWLRFGYAWRASAAEWRRAVE
jgi:RHS repeat-associated protein